ncbi:hypothetical protein L211DRAFT_833397 [Terfezia boudieri ATCC MYA-4762]|uniref:Uncharacterized protein n=1 Tax=Terfezia boudieri ATCC MYA-4762 TaxID=1051890 RepID=A0A3N4M3H1_9PEZI|nr:hypothetical protein L211DRAFT_833397 [Terfezia boudieri ATCC MYA-4762]
MDVYYSYIYRTSLSLVILLSKIYRTDHYRTTVSSGWMILQAIPLLTTPTTIITLLSPTVRETTRNFSPPTSHFPPPPRKPYPN